MVTALSPTAIGTRDQLIDDLEAAVVPGARVQMLVVFRLGFAEFTSRSGDGATDALLNQVVSRLPDASQLSGFYYQPRKNELAGLISGRLDGVEAALVAAANAVNDSLGPGGITVGYGAAVLPHEAANPTDALALADQRVTAITDGEPLPRDSAGSSAVARPAPE